MRYVIKLLERCEERWSWSRLFEDAVDGLRPRPQPSDRVERAIQEVARAGTSLYAEATNTNGFQSKKSEALLHAIRWLDEAREEDRAEWLKRQGRFDRERATPMLDRLTKDLASIFTSIDGRQKSSKRKSNDASWHKVLCGPLGLAALLEEARRSDPAWYRELGTGVPYSTDKRQTCAAQLVTAEGTLFMEWRLLTLKTESGKPNDKALTEILSPYRQHRSALTDCLRLSKSNFAGGKAIVIAGYNYKDMPLEPAVSAFEASAAAVVRLSQRCEASFTGLSHPVHQEGKVFAWLIEGEAN